jgi:hypothetical protein
MNRFPRVLALTVLFTLSAHTVAQTPDYPGLAGVDLTPVVNFLKGRVRTLKQPVYVWNWFSANGRTNPIWRSRFPSNDPYAIGHFSYMTGLYWKNFCSFDGTSDPADCGTDPSILKFGKSGMFGAGLYASIDPVDTQLFAGNSHDDWLVTQIKVPAGARVIDVMQDATFNSPPEVQAVFQNLNCPTWSSAQEFLAGVPNYSGITPPEVDPKCKLAIRWILKEALKIDAFVFRYTGRSFKECASGSYRGAALVIANDQIFVKPGADSAHTGEIKVFNKLTTDSREDRLRIQSLFYKNDSDERDNYQSNYYQRYYQNHQVSSSDSSLFYTKVVSARGANPTLVEGCPKTNPSLPWPDENSPLCDLNIVAPDMPPTPYPTTIRQSTVPLSTYGSDILWKEFEGVPTDPKVGEWISQNLMFCGRPSEYE